MDDSERVRNQETERKHVSDLLSDSKIDVAIRWMIRRDMKHVLDIENHSFWLPWSEDDFIRHLRQRNCIGMIAEHHADIVGFMVYELHRSHLYLTNFAVHERYRRRGIGNAMIHKLKNKLSFQRRRIMSVHVRETNVDAQLFFRSCGLRATEVVRGFYESDETDEDAYLMQLRL